MQMTKTARVVLGLLLIGSLTSCKVIENLRKGQGLKGNVASASGETAASREEQKDAELSLKLEGYIDCLNFASADASRARLSYLMHVDEARGPTGKEANLWVPEINTSRCLPGIEKAKTLPPQLPELETLAANYRAALDALLPLVKGAHDYYDHKDFKDDNWQRGKQLHPELIAAFAKFNEAHVPFNKQVTELNDAVSSRRLLRLAHLPEARFQFLIEKALDDAKSLVKLADAEFSKLDVVAFGERLDAYEKSFNEFRSYEGAHPEEASRITALTVFRSSAEDYLKAAKELMRRKRDNRGFEAVKGNPENVDGHPAQVVARYNRVVNASNSLFFKR
ncbi:MAG TPA: DUF3829 domain-containing protein [Polyangiaceae bacterium]|nr:DUF3829 domain-containing protein [Polyangiaceae bacterium]